MFAIVIERQALELHQVPALIVYWLEVVGALALVAMVVCGSVRLFNRGRGKGSGTPSSWLLSGTTFGIVLLLSIVCYAVGGGLFQVLRTGRRTAINMDMVHAFLAAGGALAIAGICAPLLVNLTQISPRRVGALARLSFKEAIRRRVLLAFSIILVGFLFAGWFLTPKPEHQLSTYVRFVSFMMSVFLLFIAALLASFGIPGDLKTQAMYTIVTKPVERFEIVLGRCLGYTMLMTLVLAAMSVISLIYVARGIDPDAQAESYKARVSVFGDLRVLPEGGVSVGREWEYRRYIQGGATNEEAVWSFPTLPSDLGVGGVNPWVPCEFAFDIFRTTKGKEGRAIRCSFLFTNWKWDERNEARYKQELAELQENPDPAILKRAEESKPRWTQDQKQAVLRDQLAERYGIYELHSKEIKDYHTLAVAVPTGLFKGLGDHSSTKDPAALKVRVRCEDATQYLGVARHDLYLLNAERSFALNFFKGSVGLWCRLILVIVVAVTLSTYLSGIISFLTTLCLYLGGLIVDFISEVALGRTQGGGPFESFFRLVRGTNMMAPVEDTTAMGLLRILDFVFRIVLYPVLMVIPSVERHDLSNYVAQGFDVSAGQLLADNLLPVAGYLIPWMVLAYYLMRSREIASE